MDRTAVRLKIVLFGKRGQVGRELQRSLSLLGDVFALSSQEMDFLDPANIQEVLKKIQPDIIVNAAAYTAVDKAESEASAAYRINSSAVQELADFAHATNAWLVHYSTDYVFDGKNPEAYQEDDAIGPLNVYGDSKAQGEQFIRQSQCKHLIFRLTWVFSPYGHNFAKTILKLSLHKDSLKVVADQQGVPSSAEMIADVTAHCLHQVTRKADLESRNYSGTYHLTPQGSTHWHEYAQYLVTQAQKAGWPVVLKPENIFPISTDQYPVPARRPANSLLDTQKLRQTFYLHLPHWTLHVDRFIHALDCCFSKEIL